MRRRLDATCGKAPGHHSMRRAELAPVADPLRRPTEPNAVIDRGEFQAAPNAGHLLKLWPRKPCLGRVARQFVRARQAEPCIAQEFNATQSRPVS